MTRSLLIYVLMLAALASLAAVLVDAVRGLRRASSARATNDVDRRVPSSAYGHGTVPTTS
jgi:hypothetical protein